MRRQKVDGTAGPFAGTFVSQSAQTDCTQCRHLIYYIFIGIGHIGKLFFTANRQTNIKHGREKVNGCFKTSGRQAR